MYNKRLEISGKKKNASRLVRKRHIIRWNDTDNIVRLNF